MFRAGTRSRTLAAALSASALAVSSPEAKPSIYPTPTPDVVLEESPLPLEEPIRQVRLQTQAAYADLHGRLQGAVGQWIGIEHAIESRLRSLRAPEEPLTPGFLYTGIAALSGSILTARRSLPLRILAPPTFFILAFNHFLPKTAENTYDYVEELEDRYAPRFGQIRRTSIAHSRMALDRVSDSVQAGRDQLWESTRKGVRFVQETTGLKLGDAFGLEKRTTADTKSFITEKVAEAKDVVDAKAANASATITEAKSTIQAKAEESGAKVDKAIVEVQQEQPKVVNEPPKRLV